MQCAHFDAGRCRSCTLLEVPREQQVRELEADVRRLLSGHVPEDAWRPPFVGAEAGFRNKAKLAVGGTREAPTFGILDRQRRGVDLRDCGLYEPALADALVPLTDAVADLGLVPFDVTRRTGEFKHLLVTASPDGELMVRFVLRSPGQVPRIRRGLAGLRAAVPGLRVVSVNIQPEHKAVLEGDEEILISDADHLAMRLGDLDMHLRPGGFFQTNTEVAAALYAQARAWVADIDPRSVLDLYCGVGGFALSAAVAAGAPGRDVLGVEVSPEAVASARTSGDAIAASTGTVRPEVRVADARESDAITQQMVIVNPPRRGLGARLCAAITSAAPQHLVYSSCNPETLARDLGRLPRHRVRQVRVFDMFPQTRHVEVMVLAERFGPLGPGAPGP